MLADLPSRFPSTVPMIISKKMMAIPPLAQLTSILQPVMHGLCLRGSWEQAVLGKMVADGVLLSLVKQAVGVVLVLLFWDSLPMMDLTMHGYSKVDRTTEGGWTGTSGAVNNKNWTPGSKDVPVILAMWDGTATTATLNGSIFQNSGAAGTIDNQDSGFTIGAADPILIMEIL